jgi:hypothetical protein
MRKLLISILLASAAAAPAMAQERGNARWQNNSPQSEQGDRHDERQQAREERRQAREQARAERAPEVRPERPAPPAEASPPVRETRGGFDRPRFERSERNVAERFQRPDRNVAERYQRPDRTDAPNVAERYRRPDRTDTPNVAAISPERQPRSGGFTGERREQGTRERGNWQGRERGEWNRREGDLRQSTRPVPNVMRTRNPLVVSERPREGTQPPLRSGQRRWASGNWNTNWRNDGRYDWRRYRDRNRSRFHIGIYYDPFGWSYRPYQIGWRLWPGYYGRQYWINDPYQYRLPFAPAGTVWVRYWDDALLVDTWSGEVIDVIHNFFW